MKKKQRFDALVKWASSNMPSAQSELNFSNPYELIVAVILSAQCTDKRVNMHTSELFKAYPDIQALSKASSDEIFPFIQSISFPRSKAEHLSAMAKMVMERFGGEIPSEVESLKTLPGVGPKTAAVVASVAFDKPFIAVDTHVFRVAGRLGLSDAPTPEKMEKELEKGIEPALRPRAHHWLILHGRYVCTARKPKCSECGMSFFCRKFLKDTASKRRTNTQGKES